MARGKNISPFHDKAGNLHFPFRALESKAFIYPCPPPETLGKENLICIPQEFQEHYQDKTGIIMSIGPGYYDKKNRWNPTDPHLKPGTKVFFDNSVPWSTNVLGQDGHEYKIFICVEADILGVFENE